MVFLVADDTTLLKKVQLFIEPIEVYDTNGKILGLFVPANLERCKERYAQLKGQIDWAEIERRKQSKEQGGTLQETWSRIRLLEQEMERRKAAGEPEFTTEEALAYFRALQDKAATDGTRPTTSEAPMESGSCATP